MKGPEIEAMEERAREWDRRFMSLSREVSTWSKDPSTKVGAVIIDNLRQVVALGYNGFPRGVKDTSERYANREEKYPRVVHAELNAILSASRSVEDCTLYCTLLCCCECAKAIIQAGIHRVVVPECGPDARSRWGDSQLIACEMFDEAGVEVDFA